MSCNNNCYLPIPPRAWSRVQNSCSLFDQNTYSGDALVTLPYSGRQVPASTLYLEYAMLNKGNVLQYKKNSSNLTKQQRYAQIAKGQWTNRNTTWATQSTRGYTNPNNQSLQRVNSVNITLDGQPTLAPVTCPKPVTPVYEPLPGTSSSGANPQVIPPPPPPPTVNTGTELPPAIVEPPVEPIVIQDLGNLVCGTQENVCTGEVIRQLVADNCHPTSDSDVPGPLMELCWNDGNPTWYPRQRYVMTNSGNKWPTNATLLSAIRPLPADIISVTNVENVVTLTWTFDPTCLPVNDFIIYENGIPIKIVSGTTFTTSIVVDNCATYTFYIIGSNGSVVSDPSNSVSIDIFILAPTITSINSTCNGGITITWDFQFQTCYDFDYYTIYQNGLFLADNVTSPYTVNTSPIACSSYSYYVTTTYTNGIVSPPSNTVTTEKVPCAIQDLSISNLEDTCLTLTWTNPFSSCTVSQYNLYKNGVLSASNVTSSYNVKGLSPITTYSFYILSVGSPNTAQSNIVSATTYSNAPTNLLVTSSCDTGTVDLSWTAPNSIYLCDSVVSYNIYNIYNNITTLIGNTSSINYIILGSTLTCGSNIFYVKAVLGTSPTTESLSSDPAPITLSPCKPTIAVDPASISSTSATITWTLPLTKCIIISYNIYRDDLLIANTTDLFYNATGLTTGQTYTFYVKSVGASSQLSDASNTVSVTPVYSTPVITIPAVFCYKEATVSWTNVDTPIYYYFTLYLGINLVISTIVPSVIFSYTCTGLTNGSSYTAIVTAVYINPNQNIVSDPYNFTQPVTSSYFTYSTPGGLTSSPNGSNTDIYITLNGTLTYSCSTTINNIPIILVGGGGGGGAGVSNFIYSGGGGGGGEVQSNTINILQNNSIIIGAGGAGGISGQNNPNNGSNGGTTTVNALSALGGNGGKGGFVDDGAGGSAVSGGGAGGNGRQGGGNGGVGTYSYSGGGGGGSANNSSTSYGGKASFESTGGIGGGNTGIYNGETCITYGGGGGGGSNSNNSGAGGNGGNGGNGIVVLTIPN
jgi:hypothetical protein